MDQTTLIIIVVVVIVFIVIVMSRSSAVKGSVTRQEDIDWLRTNGNKVIAQVTKVEPRMENNEQYYHIIAEWPSTNQTVTFEDRHYLYDLREYIGESYVHVAVHPTDHTRYFIYGVEAAKLPYPNLPPLILGSTPSKQTEGFKNTQDIEALYKDGGGMTVKAKVRQIISENNGTSHYLMVEYTEPHTYKSLFFRSGNFANIPTQFSKGKEVTVRYNPTDPKQYYVDLYSEP